MKLWLISQDVNNGYDTYDSAVVAAETEEDARQIRPDEKTWPKRERFCVWAATPNQVQVELIGQATEGTKAGLILASFNAG